MTEVKWDQVSNGEWIEPDAAIHHVRCCDCGLVHRVEWRVVGKQVQFRAWRVTKR